ncbi:tRNA lysidine(34) synthetase TilS [Aurantiacibacter suaedae]|uniref:tRNA lysidine(34) synthetase TilS n=1 Tax=Aurantiacibacter suaedae TaxID=2545755 RepID=UPI0010F9F526|nr:tRNA lysidine(34) synthetase TilS [Aurantiacibacter suaedae]
MSETVPPELVARFREALARLNPEQRTIGLAVSGGPDSMAMLLLAHAAIPGRFEVATVNHGLRPEAADECALVAAACDKRGIRCDILKVSVGEGNVQATAREVRYGALCGWADGSGLAALATAHHADDQAETFLMRLNRGSGVAGLAGVREVNFPPYFDCRIIRPLLHFRRAELAQVVAGEAVAHDPSNHDPRYDRVAMRQHLAGCEWLDPLAISRSASILAEAYEAVEDYADLLWRQAVRPEGEGYVITPVPAREMNRRLLARVLEKLGGRPRGGDVARLLMKLEAGEGGNVAGVLARVKRGEWVLRREPSRRA